MYFIVFMNYFYGLFYSCVDYFYKPTHGKNGNLNFIFSLILILLHILLLIHTFLVLRETVQIMFRYKPSTEKVKSKKKNISEK